MTLQKREPAGEPFLISGIYPVRVSLMFIVLQTLTGEAVSLDVVRDTKNISETLTGCKTS